MSTPATPPAPLPVFNLLDEPWLPVLTLDGQTQEVSLSAALLHARQYRALAETSPPNLVALYRLLLAMLHRALTTQHGPWRDSDRARWFRQGLPEAALRDYLTQWREEFWLHHPERPFMQVAALADAPETSDKTKPWTQISLEAACGNTPVMFDHALDDQPRPLPLGQACRSLLGYLQFIPGGTIQVFKTSDKDGPLTNTAAAIPLGRNLAETLLLALHPYDSQRADDLPAWELPPPQVIQLAAPPTLATGPNDRYTRLTRAVLLVPESGGAPIRHIRFGAGIGLDEDVNAPDPMASYRRRKDGTTASRSFTEGQAVWRDLPTLLPSPNGVDHPAVLDRAANLFNFLGKLDEQIQILIAGLASTPGKMKLLRWRAEYMTLPPAFLTDASTTQQLRQHIQQAEDLYNRLLGIAATLVAHTMPDAEHKDTRSRAQAIVTHGPMAAAYYTQAERGLPQLMQHLALADDTAADTHWRATLALAVRSAWAALILSLGQTPAVLRALARADARYHQLLRSLLSSQPSTLEETP